MKYFENKRLNRFLLFSPLLVLILTRLGIELFTNIFDSQISWIPAFLGYYFSIVIIYLIIRFVFNTQIFKHLDFKLKPVPKIGLLVLTILTSYSSNFCIYHTISICSKYILCLHFHICIDKCSI